MDDFDREIYCLGGLPFDALDLQGAVCHVRTAAIQSQSYFISTPNLNFIMVSQTDSDFRESVYQSDLSLADGMPIIWMSKLMGLPIRERVAGSDLFASLGDQAQNPGKQMSVFFFGGESGVAAKACQALNEASSGLHCVGSEYPGFGTVASMSDSETIKRINASSADFLIVSLGAAKGQAWITHNRGRINAPLISHLGAVVNFVAGRVARSPEWMQRSGLEWLWRIKEEPGLLHRYVSDGFGFIGLLLTRVFPYAIWLKLKSHQSKGIAAMSLTTLDSISGISIKLSGTLSSERLAEVRVAFRWAADQSSNVSLDLEHATYIDAGFIGLVLMLRKHVLVDENAFELINLPQDLKKVFYWCGMECLLRKDR